MFIKRGFTMERIKFTSINKLSIAYQSIKGSSQFVGVDDKDLPLFDENLSLPVIKYRGTVKLHGTCSGVSLQGDEIVPLSKERILSVESDNDGFAQWALSKDRKVWLNLFDEVKKVLNIHTPDSPVITLFGEWCGKGIQKKAAITKCERMFSIFAIRIGNEEDNGGKAIGWLPLETIDNLSNEKEMIFNTLMFENYVIEVDWNKPKELEEIIENETQKINDICPVSSYFGVMGVGEGIVWIPVDCDYFNNTRLWFKTKGESHKQNKKSKDSSIEPEILNNLNEVIEEYLVENRLERGIAYFKESGIILKHTNTKLFINFIVEDIFKDASEHLSKMKANELMIKKMISKYTGRWFNSYLEKME